MGKLGTRNASCTKQQNIFYRATIGSAFLDLQANLRQVIPKETRATLGIETKNSLEIFVSNDAIMLRKYALSCVFCGENDNLIEYKGSTGKALD